MANALHKIEHALHLDDVSLSLAPPPPDVIIQPRSASPLSEN